MYQVILSKQAAKDAKAVRRRAGRQSQAAACHPAAQSLAESSSHEKLKGDLSRFCSRRINIQHRLVYEVLEDQKTVHVLRMWTHYE